MAAPPTTTRTAVANTQLSAGKRILVLRAFRRMWKPLVDASQLDRQGRWMSTTQGGKPCFMFSQGDAAPAFFDHAADYKLQGRAHAGAGGQAGHGLHVRHAAAGAGEDHAGGL